MEELTLEKEFEVHKLRHMYDVLNKRITQYYRSLEGSGVSIPNFMRNDSPEELARKEMNNILTNGNKEHFYNLYEKAYHELAVAGDF